MQNSSKKSLRPSPSQPSRGNEKPKTGPEKKSAPNQGPVSPAAGQMVERPFRSGGRVLKMPLGGGFCIFIEGRQLRIIVVASALYIFAALVASEWIYLLSASFLVALVLGTVIPFIELLGIEANYSLPQEISPMETASIRVHLRRVFRLGPLSWMIPSRALRLTVNMQKRGTDGKPIEVLLSPDPVYIDKLNNEDWFTFPTPSLKRGIYFLNSIELSTCFPFGITWWSRTVNIKKNKGDADTTITVYPNVLPISGNFLYRLSGIISPMGQATSSSVITHQSSSFRSVREFKSGDSLRHIHWASTARQGKVLVREFDSEMLPVFDLLLNLRGNYRNPDQFELAVTLINSLVHLGHNLGHMPRLLIHPPIDSPEVQSLLFDLPNMPPGLGSVAETLARVEPITKIAANRTTFEEEPVSDDFENWSKVQDRPILTVVPTGDKIVKYAAGKGDVVCLPVDIIEVPPNWADDDEPLPGVDQDGDKVNFKSARGAAAKKSEKADFGPTRGTVIGRVEWEGDFEGL